MQINDLLRNVTFLKLKEHYSMEMNVLAVQYEEALLTLYDDGVANVPRE